MTLLYALPYDISADGFYFRSEEDFKTQSKALTNEDGYPVEEFEIQLIDGELIDIELFNAISINQVNFRAFLTACEEWDDDQKTRVIIAAGEAGYNFDIEKDDPEEFDIDIYEMDSLKELAEHFVDEGLLGEIPDNLRYYFDYEAFASDLAVEYCEISVGGKRLIYRCS